MLALDASDVGGEAAVATSWDGGKSALRPPNEVPIMDDSFVLMPSKSHERIHGDARESQKLSGNQKVRPIQLALVLLCFSFVVFPFLALRLHYRAAQATKSGTSNSRLTAAGGYSEISDPRLSRQYLDEIQRSEQVSSVNSRTLAQHESSLDHQHKLQENSATMNNESEVAQSHAIPVIPAAAEKNHFKITHSSSGSPVPDKSVFAHPIAALPAGSGTPVFDMELLPLPEVSAYGFQDHSREDADFALLLLPVVSAKVEAGLGPSARQDLGNFMALEWYINVSYNRLAVDLYDVLLPIIRKAEAFGVAEQMAKTRLHAALTAVGPLHGQAQSSVPKAALLPQNIRQEFVAFMGWGKRADRLLMEMQNSLNAGVDSLAIMGSTVNGGVQLSEITGMIKQRLESFLAKGNAAADGPISALRTLHCLLKAKCEYINSILQYVERFIADATEQELALILERFAYAEHALGRARWTAALALANADMPMFFASIV